MIRWLRYIGLILFGVFLGAAGAFLYHWLRVRGTNVEVPLRQPGAVVLSATPQEMRLWPGKAPGSETWTQRETESTIFGEHRLYNVIDPTLTAYFPLSGSANGTSIIVCPGGSYYLLSIDSEGVNIARFLNSLGIAAFVLRYRLTRSDISIFPGTMYDIRTPGGTQAVLDEMTPLIIADGQQAVRIVRSHAAGWGLDPHRVGVIGFSSGGYLALNLAVHHDADSMPNFAAPIYPVPSTLSNAKPDPIPMFIACANDDKAASCVETYNVWHSTGAPLELHVFAMGGHGFALQKQNLPSDTWPELFEHWLKAQGYLSPSAAK